MLDGSATLLEPMNSIIRCDLRRMVSASRRFSNPSAYAQMPVSLFLESSEPDCARHFGGAVIPERPPEIPTAFALRDGFESYDSLPETCDFATSCFPASPPIVKSAIPIPVQTAGSVAL